MVKFVGCIELPGFCLRYYVYGNARQGYGVRICSISGETACRVVSRDLLTVVSFTRRLMRCMVFPGNLDEVIDDFLYECFPVDKDELRRYTKINKMEGSV